MQEWIGQNALWIITAAFGAGGFVWMMRQLVTRFDKHEQAMASRFDEHKADIEKRFDRLDANDIALNRDVSDLKVRMARQEERTEVLSEIRAQIADIWKHIMRSKE